MNRLSDNSDVSAATGKGLALSLGNAFDDFACKVSCFTVQVEALSPSLAFSDSISRRRESKLIVI